MDTENYLNFSKFDFSKEHNMVFVKQAIRGTQEAAMDRYFIGSLEKISFIFHVITKIGQANNNFSA